MAAFEPVDGGEDRACRGASAPRAGMKVPGLGFGGWRWFGVHEVWGFRGLRDWEFGGFEGVKVEGCTFGPFLWVWIRDNFMGLRLKVKGRGHPI